MKVNWKDDIYPGERRYQLRDNGDNTVTLVDETVYTQRGDAFGAKELDEIGNEVNRVQSVKQIILRAAAWTGNAPNFTQTVTVDGMIAKDVPTPGIIYPSGCTRAQQKAIDKASGYISGLTSNNGSITAKATLKPTVDITIGLKGV